MLAIPSSDAQGEVTQSPLADGADFEMTLYGLEGTTLVLIFVIQSLKE